MSGDLIQTFRRTLAKIAEIEERMAADQAEVAALRGEVEELRNMLRPDFVAAESEALDAGARAIRKRPIRDRSSVGFAQRVLRMIGGPLHVDEIITNIEHMTGAKVNKTTLVSSLSRYVKAGDTFKRTAANTFGLLNYDDEPREIRLVG